VLTKKKTALSIRKPTVSTWIGSLQSKSADYIQVCRLSNLGEGGFSSKGRFVSIKLFSNIFLRVILLPSASGSRHTNFFSTSKRYLKAIEPRASSDIKNPLIFEVDSPKKRIRLKLEFAFA